MISNRLTQQDIEKRVNAVFPTVLDVLSEKVSLAAVSALGIPADHMKKSAEFVAEVFTRAGLKTKVVQSRQDDGTAGAWEVVGEKHVDENAPTVLLYAHHDVQPVPKESEWETHPFEATIRDGRMYGRGSADDGGGIAIHAGSLLALAENLNVNIKIFIEGEEEMGSPSFIPFIKEHLQDFQADLIIVADSGNWSDTIPSLTTSLRGNTCLDVTVSVLDHPVHSGQFGGPILDAYTSAATLISSMYNEKGELVIDGLMSKEPIGGLQQDIDEATLRKDASVIDSYQLAGTGSLASRLWTKPSVTVIGIDAHDVDSSFNVIEPSARFRLSVRTSPEQNPQEAQQAVKLFLEKHAPFGAHVHVELLDTGMGWAMDPNADATKIALQSMQDAFGVDPVNKGEGGSIPFIPELQKMFPNTQVLVTGPEDPKSNAHSPNESISIEGLRKNIIAQSLLLYRLGKSNS